MFGLFALSCTTQQKSVVQHDPEHELKPEKNEDGEWDLDVLDTNYNYFLSAVARPMDFYSESFLRSRNTLLVTEWNNYFYSGRYRDVIESSIQYDPNENYGKTFDYKLYQVFVFVRWKYGLKMNGISQTEWVN